MRALYHFRRETIHFDRGVFTAIRDAVASPAKRRSRSLAVPDSKKGSRAMDKTFDAIIVCARCAGSPTAMPLARKGYRVLLLVGVDRRNYGMKASARPRTESGEARGSNSEEFERKLGAFLGSNLKSGETSDDDASDRPKRRTARNAHTTDRVAAGVGGCA
jgi:hypothetical protein